MKNIKAVLFDLDGTLLPMEQAKFMKAYFGRLSKRMAERGYDPTAFIGALWEGTKAMVKNDGSASNECVFWNKFSEILGDKILEEQVTLDEFYETDFELVRESCGFDPTAAPAVRKLREAGYKTVLATNPLFPSVATRARMRWAGLTEEDFEFFTAYENSRFTKPNLDYYREIAARLGVSLDQCLMVGNDVGEDMIAEELGMKVFLTDKCLINNVGKDASDYPRGTFDELCSLLLSDSPW